MAVYTPHRQRGGLRQWWPFAAAGVAVLLVVALLVGSFLLGRGSAGGAAAPGAAASHGGVSGPAEDALVNAAWPYPVPGNLPEPITLPAPTSTTPLGVPTGFPRTPEGALAQLSAYTRSSIEAGPDVAKQINVEWMIPGGPGGGDSAEFIAVKQKYGAVITYTFNPTMGIVRGISRDGDFVYACVLGAVSATIATTGSVKTYQTTGCGRLWWTDDRWRIENKTANEIPAEHSPVPGSTAAYQSGWADLR